MQSAATAAKRTSVGSDTFVGKNTLLRFFMSNTHSRRVKCKLFRVMECERGNDKKVMKRSG